MNSYKFLLIGSLILFLGCTNGSLTPGVGESGRYLSLVEEVNERLTLTQQMFEGVQENNSYVNFRIEGVESIKQLDNSSAYLSIPGANIEEVFEKTEIIKFRATILDQDNMISHWIATYLFATKDEYYSESEFPLRELYYFVEAPWFNSGSGLVSSNYILEDIEYSSGMGSSSLLQNGPILEFEFTNRNFIAYKNWQEYVGNYVGSGKISAEKVGEFPEF